MGVTDTCAACGAEREDAVSVWCRGWLGLRCLRTCPGCEDDAVALDPDTTLRRVEEPQSKLQKASPRRKR